MERKTLGFRDSKITISMNKGSCLKIEFNHLSQLTSKIINLALFPILSLSLISCNVITDKPLVYESFLLPLDQKKALAGHYQLETSTDIEKELDSSEIEQTSIEVMDKELLFDGAPMAISGVPYNPGLYVLTAIEGVPRVYLLQFAPERLLIWSISSDGEFSDHLPEGQCELYCVYEEEEIKLFLLEYGSRLVDRDPDAILSRID